MQHYFKLFTFGSVRWDNSARAQKAARLFILSGNLFHLILNTECGPAQ
jgi:hypothetical protein